MYYIIQTLVSPFSNVFWDYNRNSSIEYKQLYEYEFES